MKYDLEHIEKKVKEAIQSDDQDVLDQFRKSLAEDVKSVLKTIQIRSINFDSAKELKRYIQYHQQSLTMQLDELTERIETNPNCKKLGEAICLQLEKVFDCLRVNYPKQFLYNSAAPKSYSRKIKKNYCLKLISLGRQLREAQ